MMRTRPHRNALVPSLSTASARVALRLALASLVALWLYPALAHGAIQSVTFPATAFRPAEGPQPPLPPAPLQAGQAVLTVDVDATPSDYRALVKPTSNPDKIVATKDYRRTAAAGTRQAIEIAVPLEEGANTFTVTLQDQKNGAFVRTSPLSPVIVRDLQTSVLKVTLDAIQPPTRSTSAANAVIDFTLNGTAASYQIDVVRNAVAATTFTTDRVGAGRVTVPLLPNTSNDFFLRATANDALAAGQQVVSNILTVVADTQAPTFANVSIFPGPSTANAVVNVVGLTEPFSKVTVDNGSGKTFSTEADLAGNFVVLGVGVPFLPPGPTLNTFTITAVDPAGNRAAPLTRPLTRIAADPRFEFLEITPPSGSLVRPGVPVHVRGSVGEKTGPFTVTFFIRQTTGSFQIEEKITNLGGGEAFEKDFHLTPDVSNPDRNVIYSVEAEVESTSGRSPRQLAGEIILDNSDPAAPEFDRGFDGIVITNSPKLTANGAAERFSTINFNVFPGVGLFPSSRIPVESTPIVIGGEFRNVVDLSKVIDGLYSVTATAIAASGRFSPTASARELRFQRDTTAPFVKSVSINGRQANNSRTEFFAPGQVVTLRVEYSEPMSLAPDVFVTQRGSFALPASLSATVLPDLIFDYTFVVLPGEEFQGPVDVIVTGGLDRAGNPLTPEARVRGLFFVDALPPVLDPANTRPAPGSVVSSAPNPIFISVLENPRSLQPASGVDIEATQVQAFGPIETDPTTERSGFVNVFSPQSVTFQFDEGQFIKQGTYQLRVTVRDFAGNTDTVDLVYKLDTEAISPVFVTATVPGDGAILNAAAIPSDSRGRTVLSATLSPTVTAELDLARSRMTLEQACPSVRPVAASVRTSAPDRIELVLSEPLKKDGADDGQYLLRVLPRDVAGNESQNILRSFVLDTQKPAVLDGALVELGRFGNSTDDTFFPARGQMVTGPLTAIRATVVDAVSSNGYPGSGVNTSPTTGSTIVLTLVKRHPTTLASLPEGSSTTNNSLLQSVIRFRDVVPPVTSPCYTGPKRANVFLELRVDPSTGRPSGLTTGGDFDGEWDIRVVPVDQAGNTGTPSRSGFVFDTIAPTVLTLEGVTSGEVFTGRSLAITGTVADNGKTPADNGQGIDRVLVSVFRADGRFVTTGAPLVEPTTATLSPNVRLVQAGTVINYRLSAEMPEYDGNAVLVVEAIDVAGNRTAVVRQFTVRRLALERPALSAPAHESSTSGPVIDFHWAQVPGASGYLLTVTDPNRNPITRRTGAAEPGVTLNLDKLVEGRYTWTVNALDTSGRTGDPSHNFVFYLDVTPPAVREVFAYDATVPDAHAGDILDGQIRIGIRFSEPMDLSRPPTVTLKPANSRLGEVVVRQISFDESSWRGLVDIQPDPASPDFNGPAIIGVGGARDVAGNPMPVTSEAFEVDVGPFWQVRAFANPIQRSEILFHIKALTQENGVPEPIESLPLLTVTQPGGPAVNLTLVRRGEAVFSGVYTVNRNFPGNARLAITGTDTRGNTSTRLLDFPVTSIIAANRNQVTLPNKAGTVELPANALAADGALAAFGEAMTGGLEDASATGAARGAGLAVVAPVAGFVPEPGRLGLVGRFRLELDRFPTASSHPAARLGLYRLQAGRFVYQPGAIADGALVGELDGLSPLYLMADIAPPAIEPSDASGVR
ncbi:MAG: Ig-like domain repeat protein, partial [Candidatus Wallbacteria bacterium]|nr:Ig-like domain repeat protein [Candidatus Wallbacteria bacterium]